MEASSPHRSSHVSSVHFHRGHSECCSVSLADESDSATQNDLSILAMEMNAENLLMETNAENLLMEMNAGSSNESETANASRPAYWLVPAGPDGQPEPTRAVKISEASQLNEILSPVEPFYTMSTVAAMLCLSKSALEHYLFKNKAKFTPRYRRTTVRSGPVWIRLFPAREVRMMADDLIKPRTKRPRK